MYVRLSTSKDIPLLQTVLDQTGVFPSEMLPEMIASFLSDGASRDVWMTVSDADDVAVGFCYAVQEQFADGTWNMLAIAVLPERQGTGYGRALVKAMEDALRTQGHRVLIVDTSSNDDFALAREFYRKNGYVQEARIRDFWAAGDDKVTFWKQLA